MSGVAFNQPPDRLIPDLAESIGRALAELPDGANGAIIGVATETGLNAAVVARVNDDWSIRAWLGKSWGGKVTGGAQILGTW